MLNAEILRRVNEDGVTNVEEPILPRYVDSLLRWESANRARNVQSFTAMKPRTKIVSFGRKETVISLMKNVLEDTILTNLPLLKRKKAEGHLISKTTGEILAWRIKEEEGHLAGLLVKMKKDLSGIEI